MCLNIAAIGGTVLQNHFAVYLGSAGLDISVACDAEAFVTVMKDLDPASFPVHDCHIRCSFENYL